MKRPIFWEFDSPGQYLYAQYKYVRKVRKVKAKDFLVLLNFKNRSSLYNLFRDHVHINPDKIQIYRTVFKLNEEEAEYLILLTVRDMSSSNYEKNVWAEKVKEFIGNKVTEQAFEKKEGVIFDMWDDFVKAKETLEVKEKEDKVAS